ncbi:MAG: hypothetical protein COS95_09370, partial [Ignavibacteriales bacterium CG07_land_8_20_14_0_80_59_12]
EGMLRSSATFVKLGSGMSTSPMFLGDTAVVGDSSGTVHFLSPSGPLRDVRTGMGPIIGLAATSGPSAGWTAFGTWGVVSSTFGRTDSIRVPTDVRAGSGELTAGSVSPPSLLILLADGRVARFTAGAGVVWKGSGGGGLARPSNEPKLPSPYITNFDPELGLSVADVNGGTVYGISGGAARAVNFLGATSDGFPVHFRTGSVSSMPVAGLLNDKRGVLLVGDSAGVVHVVDAAGKELSGFPVQTGGAVTAPVTLAPDDSGSIIFASSSDGYLYAWRTTLSVQGSGAQFLGSPAHENWTLITPVSAPPAGSPVLVASRTYNWPNPLYTSSGYIRFFLNADASVSIKVYDLSGFKVQELTAFGRGGMDNEIPWDVSGLGSGVYIVRVSAASGSRTDNTTFKAAIVR